MVNKNILIAQNASTAMDVALIMPVLLSLIFVMVDLGRLMITDTILQSALGTLVNRQRYLIVDGENTVSEETSLVTLKKILRSKGNGWIDLNRVTLATTPVMGEARQTYSGVSGAFLQYEIIYLYSSRVPLVSAVLGNETLMRRVKMTVRH